MRLPLCCADLISLEETLFPRRLDLVSLFFLLMIRPDADTSK